MRPDDRLPVPLVRDFRDGYLNRMALLPVGKRWAGSGSAPDFTRRAEPSLHLPRPPDPSSAEPPISG
jgi:hypothetical protein